MQSILQRLMENLRYPFQDPKWVPKLAIGGVLDLIPIANLISWGYIYKIFVDALSQSTKEELPEWNDWRQYFAAGVYILGIGIVYAILTLLLFLLLYLLIPPLAPLLAIIPFTMVLPMAIARFTVERKFSAAFNFARIQEKIRLVARDYVLTALLFTLIIDLSGLILLGGPLGILIWPFWSFYLMIAFSRMIGEIIAETVVGDLA